MRGRIGNRKALQASVTVEASFIVPIVMAVIYGIILLSFFLYNRIKLAADVDGCVQEAVMHELNHEEAYDELVSRLTGYFAAEPCKAETKTCGDKLTVTVELKNRINTEGLLSIFAGHFETIRYTVSADTGRRTDIMRKLRCGEDILKLLEKAAGEQL